MRILIIHNRYQRAAGEAAVVAAEHALLEEYGHDVETLFFDNKELNTVVSKLGAAWRIAYSRPAQRRVSATLDRFRPDVAHVHNTFPLITPSVYDACRQQRVPVVQTLHNFRLICANATLYRNGGVCEDCMNGTAYQSVLHGCYRGSRIASLPLAHLISKHRKQGTWRHKVDRFIALTDFSRAKFIEAGLPADKIVVKANFAAPPTDVTPVAGDYALYVGRLVSEKGIEIMLDGWRRLKGRVPLKIAGEGPLLGSVIAAAKHDPAIEVLGVQPQHEIARLMRDAAFLVMPSIWYEGFPMVIVEALRAGLPVVTSNIGSMAAVIAEGETGLLVPAGHAQALATAVAGLYADPVRRLGMKNRAMAVYAQRYTPAQNYRELLSIYEDLLAGRNTNDTRLTDSG